MSPPSPATRGDAGSAGVGFREFVTIMAALMGINALGIDSMLPALPDIAHSLGMTHENQRQWIVTAYMLGFGATHIIYGPLSDRYGRRPLALLGLGIYVVTSVLASFSASFETMVVARALQGMGAACTRVLAVAMIRDHYAGRQMARVMSLTFIIFLAAPMLAPSIGKLILLVAPWQAIFHALALFAGGVAVWLALRLGETLRPELRRPLDIAHLAGAGRRVMTERGSIGYTLAGATTFGAQIGFITCSQQVFSDIFGEPAIFPILFAVIAAGMAVASFVNSRVVLRLGTRRVSHAALLGYIVVAALHMAVVEALGDSLVSFAMFQFVLMFCAGLTGANSSAMAMEAMGDIAGTAASVQGTISTLVGALIGIVIGQSYNGTVVPLVLGYLGCGIGSLALVLFAERGRLFRPHHDTAAADSR